MKVLKGMLTTSTFFLFLSSLFSIDSVYANDWTKNGHDKKQVYAQISSCITQIPNTTNVNIHFNDVEAIHGLQLVSEEKILIKKPGLYFVGVTANAGIQGITVLGTLDLWFIHNEQPLTQTKVSQSVYQSNQLFNLSTQAVLYLAEKDTVSIGMKGSNNSIGILAGNERPSAIFTIFRIDSDENRED